MFLNSHLTKFSLKTLSKKTNFFAIKCFSTKSSHSHTENAHTETHGKHEEAHKDNHDSHDSHDDHDHHHEITGEVDLDKIHQPFNKNVILIILLIYLDYALYFINRTSWN